MAIDDNTSYELTGYQVKDIAQKIRAKADSSSLASVATSGLYSDLTGAPTIPTVYNGTLTIQQNGTTKGTFTANQSSASTVNIETIYADDYISTSPIPTTVTTAMIENGAVTTAKIDDGAVTAAKTAFGGNYSTTEVNTGFTWIDGKTIYKKTFSFTLANAESTTVNHGISNFGLLIKFEGAAVSSSTKSVPIPRTLTSLNYQVGLEGVTTTSFEIDVGANGPRGKQAYVTLWYTKSS